MLKSVTAAKGVDLCLDCVSSIGAVSVDLKDVYLATGVSGKALSALPGVAFVFHRDPIAPAKNLPRYLDLGLYARALGAPFTQSSNILNGLLAALQAFGHERFARTALLGHWLRQRLRAMGYQIVAPEEVASPAVVSIALPDMIKSLEIGAELRGAIMMRPCGMPLASDAMSFPRQFIASYIPTQNSLVRLLMLSIFLAQQGCTTSPLKPWTPHVAEDVRATIRTIGVAVA